MWKWTKNKVDQSILSFKFPTWPFSSNSKSGSISVIEAVPLERSNIRLWSTRFFFLKSEISSYGDSESKLSFVTWSRMLTEIKWINFYFTLIWSIKSGSNFAPFPVFLLFSFSHTFFYSGLNRIGLKIALLGSFFLNCSGVNI